MSRRVRFAVLVMSLPVGLLGAAFTGLFLLNMWNPMQLGFVTTFRVRNDLRQPVWITPIGAFIHGGKGVLPQFALPMPAIPAWRTTDLPVDAGGVRVVHYDWDDINFSEILVRFGDGSQRALIVDPDPPTDAYYANKQAEYILSDVGALRPVASDSAHAVRRLRPFWGFVFGFACATTLPYWAFRWWRASAQGSQS